MIKLYLPVSILLAFSTVFYGCRFQPSKNKIMGSWHSADKKKRLKITSKNFILDEGNGAIAENYFVKDDTIFTSYEGSQPYTKFVIKNLSDTSLTLIYPDSASVNFRR